MKKPFWDVDLYMGGEDGEYYTVRRVFFFFFGWGARMGLQQDEDGGSWKCYETSGYRVRTYK